MSAAWRPPRVAPPPEEPAEVAPTRRPLWLAAAILVGLAGIALLAAVMILPEILSPADPGLLARDTFARTVAPGWGVAEHGGRYVLSGTRADYDVDGGLGRIRVPAPALTRRALLREAPATDVDLHFRVAVGSILTGGGGFVYGVLRAVDDVGEYRAKVRFASNGSVYVGLTEFDGEEERPIGEELRLPDYDYVVGTGLHIRAMVTGDSPAALVLKVWPAGAPEPAGWHVDGEGTLDGLEDGGAAGVQVYAARDAVTFPLAFRFDDLMVRRPVAPSASAGE